MAEMTVSAPMLIIVFLIALTLTLLLFQESITDIFAKQEKIEKVEDLPGRISRVVQVQGEPSVRMETCTKDTAYNYKFRITGMEALFQGLPTDEKTRQMAVFATLSFKDAVARDTQQKTITLTKGVAQPFGELEFDLRSGVAPILMHPDTPIFAGEFQVKQSVVINNYKITAIRQLKPVNPIIAAISQENCYTDFVVECRTESARASLTSCKEDESLCKKTVVLCGSRVDMQLIEYKSGTCGSRPMSFIAETNKQSQGWEYGDSAIINFWRGDAAGTCWQQAGYFAACGDKFLGSKIYNLSRENYNAGSCVPIGFL